MDAKRLFPVVLGCVLLAASPLAGKQVEEKYPNGKVKRRYSVDDQGRKHGYYEEYDEKGRMTYNAYYAHGVLNGSCTKRDYAAGRVTSAYYVKGKLHGRYMIVENNRLLTLQVWNNGTLVQVNGVKAYPKSLEEMRRTFEFIASVGAEFLDPKGTDVKKLPAFVPGARGRPIRRWNPGDLGEGAEAKERLHALRVLMMYRYLCDVPWENMVYDKDLNRYSTAAAKICAALGGLNHKPPRPPGWTEEAYRDAYTGTSHSNLSVGGKVMAHAIHMWMFDSDGRNVKELGHRRWCLNPRMLKTGIGRAGRFIALWSMDSSRPCAHTDYVMFPPRGYVPVRLFSPRHAWSIQGMKANTVPGGNFDVKVYPISPETHWVEKPLKIRMKNYSTKPYGGSNALVFFPEGVRVEPGRRYWVEIYFARGRKRRRNKGPDIKYFVEFVDLVPGGGNGGRG